MDNVQYSGIGIWITKYVTEVKLLCKIHKSLNKKTPMKMSNLSFKGQMLLLGYDHPIKTSKFKKIVSQICNNRCMLCHGVVVIIGNKHLVLLNFNSILNTKDENIFNIDNRSPDWYYMERHEYAAFMNLLQINTYEELYMDAIKKYMNDNTNSVMDKIKELVSEIYKDIHDIKQEIKQSDENQNNIHKKLKQHEEILQKIESEIIAPLVNSYNGQTFLEK